MYQRRVRPYPYGLPNVQQVQNGAYIPQNVTSQTQGEERQQQSMPNMPTGLLEKMLGGSTSTPAFGGLDPYTANAMASEAGSLGIAGYGGGFDPYTYGSMMSEAGSLGLLEGGIEGGAAAGGLLEGGAAAAEGATAAGSGASSVGMMGPWAPITIAAMIAKSQVQGSDPASLGGAIDTLLLPSAEQWMADPMKSLGNTLDPWSTLAANFTGGEDSVFNFLNPVGMWGGLFG